MTGLLRAPALLRSQVKAEVKNSIVCSRSASTEFTSRFCCRRKRNMSLSAFKTMFGSRFVNSAVLFRPRPSYPQMEFSKLCFFSHNDVMLLRHKLFFKWIVQPSVLICVWINSWLSRLHRAHFRQPLLRSMQSRRRWELHHCQGTERSRYRAKRLVRFGEGGWQVRCLKNLSFKRAAYARVFSIMKALFFPWLFVCFSKNRRGSYFCALPYAKADPISTARCARSVTSLPTWIAQKYSL